MLRDKILSSKLKVSPVQVPEWGGDTYFVRSLTGADYAKVRQLIAKLPDEVGKVVGDIWLALFALCDENGTRIMQDTDYDSFSQQPITAIATVVRAAMLNNGMGADGLAEAGNG